MWERLTKAVFCFWPLLGGITDLWQERACYSNFSKKQWRRHARICENCFVCEKVAAYLGYVGKTERTHVFGTYRQVLDDQETISQIVNQNYIIQYAFRLQSDHTCGLSMYQTRLPCCVSRMKYRRRNLPLFSNSSMSRKPQMRFCRST